MPGVSWTFLIVNRASSLVKAAPQTATEGDSGIETIMDPGASEKLLRTRMGTSNFLANSIDRLCMTLAPKLASSSISS